MVLDTIAWDRVDMTMELYDRSVDSTDFFTGGARTQLTRFTLDLAANTCSSQRLLRRTVEFPAMDPRATGRRHSAAFFVAGACAAECGTPLHTRLVRSHGHEEAEAI